MAKKKQPGRPVLGRVAISDELTELLGSDDVEAAVLHLRAGGGNCWYCHEVIRSRDDVSLIVHLTSAAGRIGFAHLRCVPPQVIDDRRSRRAAVRMSQHLSEVSSDVQGFVAIRGHPSPHGVLVVSPTVGIAARDEDGDHANPWLDQAFEHGFVPIGPDVLDAGTSPLAGWQIDVTGDHVVCGDGERSLITGDLSIPPEWLDTLQREGECLVLATGLGVSSNETDGGVDALLNLLARRGLVAGAVVAVGAIRPGTQRP